MAELIQKMRDEIVKDFEELERVKAEFKKEQEEFRSSDWKEREAMKKESKDLEEQKMKYLKELEDLEFNDRVE